MSTGWVCPNIANTWEDAMASRFHRNAFIVSKKRPGVRKMIKWTTGTCQRRPQPTHLARQKRRHISRNSGKKNAQKRGLNSSRKKSII